MADPQTADQGNWVQYGLNRRYNPDTGQVQYDLKGTGNWQTVAELGKYDPQNPLQSFGFGNPNLLSDPTIAQGANTDPVRQFLLNQGGWSLPSADTLRQINMMGQMAAQGQGQGQSSAAAAPSYYGTVPQINMGGTMQPGGTAGTTGTPGTAAAVGTQGGTGGAQSGGTQSGGNQSGGNMATQGLPSGTSASTAEQLPAGVSIPEWQAWYGRNVGKTMMVNGQSVTLGQDVGPDQLMNAFQSGNVGWNTQNVPQPESVALQQMAQVDPTSEALRQGLGASYLANLGGGPPAPKFGLDLSKGAAAPNTADVQSYLNLYKQIDPQGFAQRQALAGQMGSYLNQMQQQAALGSQLTTGQAREVDQATREAQAARGNVYGTPQLVAEAMTRGQYGIQLEQQRQQMLGQALGQQQSYLTSGAGMGDVANNLYNQGVNRYLQGYSGALSGWQAQQNARLQAQGAALGYLGSGQTPFQAGSSYLNQAQQNAASAAQGGPQYNPASLGQQYTGAGASTFPQYGLDMSQLAGNWYNNINQANLQAYGLQQAYSQKGGSAMGAGVGALGGAASGALAGSAMGPVGTVVGGLGGALAGGLSGYSK